MKGKFVEINFGKESSPLFRRCLCLHKQQYGIRPNEGKVCGDKHWQGVVAAVSPLFVSSQTAIGIRPNEGKFVETQTWARKTQTLARKVCGDTNLGDEDTNLSDRDTILGKEIESASADL